MVFSRRVALLFAHSVFSHAPGAAAHAAVLPLADKAFSAQGAPLALGHGVFSHAGSPSGPSPMACFPTQNGPRRAAALPFAHGVLSPRRVAQGRRARGGPAPPRPWRVSPRRMAARAAALPLADNGFLTQNCTGPPRARRPCPSPMASFPTQSGFVPRP
eukprot:8394371-Pyramimonas_sp.AAC.1